MKKSVSGMRNYMVYFEAFGRKMRKTVMAENEMQAKEEVAKAIIFHKVELKKDDEFNEVIDLLDNTLFALGINKKK